ncbi:MAG: lipid A deacylase LpxR family protein, partial [Planctomycetota bacterium]
YLMQPDWQWVDDFSTWHFGDAEQSVDTAIGIFLGQNIYTPNYIDRPSMRPEKDRRYAGWLYTGLFAQRATADVLDHFEINLGVIGPSSHAQETQENVHRWLGGAQPIGWEDQMDDEMAADFVFMRQQRILDGPLAPTEMADVIAEYGFTAGSVHRHAQAGVVIRYGLGLGKTFVPGRLELPSGVSALREEPKAATYLYGRATVKAIEHNRFLTGLKEEPVMGEFQIGAVYKRGRFEMSYSQTFFTQEFEEQQGVDSIGALTFSLLF